ncbi:MAG: SUMF1/EgtB/PvdO family nonheme iron enzyme [Pirellulales bacterium]
MKPFASFCAVLLMFFGSAAARGAAPPEGKTWTNGLGMKFVRIEPGEFQMGSVRGGDFDERPVHRVAISRPFYLGATEVTNAQYEKFDPAHRQVRGKLGFSKADDEAVVFVSWDEASRFCQWLGKQDGGLYRLPTEAEWEYACRAGTTTDFSTGDTLPGAFRKNVGESWFPDGDRPTGEGISLTVASTPANPWELFDMHGNVEEWCNDWYGPYLAEPAVDPVGRATGDFRVTRGGSHSTNLEYLRSANRMGTLPQDRSWVIGFRVALGEMPATKPTAAPSPPQNRREVAQSIPADLAAGPDARQPYFKGPRIYVKIPPGSQGPMFSHHNHDPAISECPNGDLLAIWYTCVDESGRELAILASRLRRGQEEWETASPFWDAPDRNDHAPALWFDGEKTLYHFNGLSAAATWGNLATILRVSTDSGVTWSAARLTKPEHGLRHMPIESVFRTREGTLVLPCDAVTGGSGGTAIHLSRDNGQTWTDPGLGRPKPDFQAGRTGAWIAGIHAGIVQLGDGRLMALGRGNSIEGRMPMSISSDMGQTWTYSASPFPPIGGGQRLVLTRLAEGPILFVSFAKTIPVKDASGRERSFSGLFAALSMDDGRTWPVVRGVTDDGPGREVETTDGQPFTLGRDSGEPRGYLSVCQARNGVIHLISSKQHYAFNLKWLTPAPRAARLPAGSTQGD